MEQRKRRNWWLLIGAGAAAAGTAYLFLQHYKSEYERAKRELEAREGSTTPTVRVTARMDPVLETVAREAGSPGTVHNQALAVAERESRQVEPTVQTDQDPAGTQDAVQSILCEEVVYSPLKDQYARFLAERSGSVPSHDLERYQQQFKIVASICDELERDPGNTSAVVTLLQKLVETGDQPPDLAAYASY
mmetsp:Transcript_39159/g.78414  ORF Transcript_39159/g.78414 Transcript_39159/m.78414 type:complete len:191 (-) Transcript_39159:113-685(-)